MLKPKAFSLSADVALDVAAGILGIQAEVAQNKVKHLRLWIFECRDPSHEAFKLALGAVILLSLAHFSLTFLVAACASVLKKSSKSLTQQATLIGLSRFHMDHTGGWIVDTGDRDGSNNKPRASCGFTHHHFLSIGGILCFVHGLFSAAYYVSSTAATDRH
ncbi:formin-like protein 5-like [Hibiscus syriacus]|uniref:Formin-like protein 5-like n=1 Tax=Hibiscus syriacus TaxID=106335 RepID=A0A6A2WNY6_HIBSY|nr:formin-like protein 5-like [Hibiscus syriacus]